jgi:hypothetical protein
MAFFGAGRSPVSAGTAADRPNPATSPRERALGPCPPGSLRPARSQSSSLDVTTAKVRPNRNVPVVRSRCGCRLRRCRAVACEPRPRHHDLRSARRPRSYVDGTGSTGRGRPVDGERASERTHPWRLDGIDIARQAPVLPVAGCRGSRASGVTGSNPFPDSGAFAAAFDRGADPIGGESLLRPSSRRSRRGAARRLGGERVADAEPWRIRGDRGRRPGTGRDRDRRRSGTAVAAKIRLSLFGLDLASVPLGRIVGRINYPPRDRARLGSPRGDPSRVHVSPDSYWQLSTAFHLAAATQQRPADGPR